MVEPIALREFQFLWPCWWRIGPNGSKGPWQNWAAFSSARMGNTGPSTWGALLGTSIFSAPMLPADFYGMSFEYNQSAVGVSWCFSLGTGRLHTDVNSWAWACCWKLLGVTTLRGVVRMEIGAISATWLGEDYKKEIWSLADDAPKLLQNLCWEWWSHHLCTQSWPILCCWTFPCQCQLLNFPFFL